MKGIGKSMRFAERSLKLALAVLALGCSIVMVSSVQAASSAGTERPAADTRTQPDAAAPLIAEAAELRRALAASAR